MMHGAADVTGRLAVGFASAAAGDKSNEDCFGLVTPNDLPDAVSRGSILALADGGSAGACRDNGRDFDI